MDVSGGLPPDKDTYSCHQTSNLSVTSSTGQNNLSSSSSSSVGILSTSQHQHQSQQQQLERLSRPMSFDKMEQLVREMQDPEMGVPVRSQKLFLTSIPSAFMGYDLIEWMMERLNIEESEALSIANQLCLHGYFFPVNDSKTLVVKDDSSLYRFQTPYYWPWQHKAPDNVEYAIYLAKRSLRNKQRHGLEEYESEALANLHKNLKAKWDFITMQAEEQVKLAKDRKKGDKIVGDSQERAYWRVHRPPPVQFTPLEPCPVPSRDRHGKPRRRTIDDLQREVDYLKASMGRTRMKMSQACECLIQYCETFSDYDFFIQPVLPSNPWVTEDITFWQLNNSIVDIPTEKRVKRWSISIEELVSDPTGLQEFTIYLKKEYSHENIRFWIAVNDLRRSAHSQISKKVKEIYEEFLEPGAPCEINIDGQTMEKVQHNLKSPSRYTFDAAADHIYTLLLKKDCYPRFVRSDHYKSLLATGIQPAHKKRFFGFGVPKKKSSTAPPIPSLLTQVPGPSMVPAPGSLIRRRGSDRSLSGSAHELAVSGVKDGANKVPHSHSQSNLSDIPYSVMIYRGDLPSGGLALPTTMEDPNFITSTTDNHDANLKNLDGSKSIGETLEPTQESSASAVCPWESMEPMETAVSVSISPWDNDEPTSLSQILNRGRNNSTVESGSSSSDISEMSDRMRRSCGLRQNTLDCDLFSSKRLAPTNAEPRRASMTIPTRVSDVQFSARQPQCIVTNNVQQQPVPKSLSPINIDCPIATTITTTQSTEQSLKNVSRAISVDEHPDESIHNLSSIELSDKFEYKCRQEQLSSANNNNDINVDYNNDKIKDNDKDKNTDRQNRDIGTDNNDGDIKTIKNNSNKSNVVKSNESVDKLNQQILLISAIDEHNTIRTTTASNSIAIEPIINPVTVTLDTVDIIDSKTVQIIDIKQLPIPPTIKVDSVTEEEDEDENDIKQLDKCIENKTSPLAIITDSKNMEIQCFEQEKYNVPQEELSPTTEEYQECCPPDDFQYDLSTDSEMLASGCVPPAPTPAPSIAPLAEVEIDPPDDESEIDQTIPLPSTPLTPPNTAQSQAHQQLPQLTQSPLQQNIENIEQKKMRRKKRDSETKMNNNKQGTSVVAQDDQSQVKNAICPWEDDDVSSSNDAPFVKTYATLGYL